MGSVIVTIIFLWLLYIARKFSVDRDKKIYAFSFSTGLMLLFLLGIQENYWEITQAIFLGCLLLKVLFALIMEKPPGEFGQIKNAEVVG
jgi:prepilin signal peptidase PulO-like enzyme (type II secretory pathway)